jgi:hypothetical protein
MYRYSSLLFDRLERKDERSLIQKNKKRMKHKKSALGRNWGNIAIGLGLLAVFLGLSIWQLQLRIQHQKAVNEAAERALEKAVPTFASSREDFKSSEWVLGINNQLYAANGWRSGQFFYLRTGHTIRIHRPEEGGDTLKVYLGVGEDRNGILYRLLTDSTGVFLKSVIGAFKDDAGKNVCFSFAKYRGGVSAAKKRLAALKHPATLTAENAAEWEKSIRSFLNAGVYSWAMHYRLIAPGFSQDIEFLRNSVGEVKASQAEIADLVRSAGGKVEMLCLDK